MTDKQIAKLQRQIIKWWDKDGHGKAPGTGFSQSTVRLWYADRYAATDNYTVILLKPDQAPPIERPDDTRLERYFQSVQPGSECTCVCDTHQLLLPDGDQLKAIRVSDPEIAVDAARLRAFPRDAMLAVLLRPNPATQPSGLHVVRGLYAVMYEGEMIGAVMGLKLKPGGRWADIDSAPET